MLYDRSSSQGIEVVDEWDNGFGWMAHPEETTRRASHAIEGDHGVWLFDPLHGPGVRDRIEELGTVEGVALQSNYHARDSSVFAERYDVSVHMPSWMDRAANNVAAQIEQYDVPSGQWVELGDSGIRLRTVDPSTAWQEAVAYRPAEGTLRVADMLSTNPFYRVGDERLGCYFFHRFAPPREAFSDIEPQRILLGHGDGIFENAPEALDSTLANARRNLPWAVYSQAPTQIRGMIGAIRG